MRHHSFIDGDSLARTLAADVAKSLNQSLATRGEASLIVAGGRTPAAFLRELGHQPLEWSRVHVTLTDERCVSPGDEGSNFRMLREAFAPTAAAAAHFPGIDPTSGDADACWSAIVSAMPRPFAAVVLGMGDDGHFASLFPHMPGLASALAPAGSALPPVVRAVAPAAPADRLSLTLATLLDTDLLALHVTGASKLTTLQRASQPGSVLDMPVRALLEQRRAKLEIYHAP